MAPRTTFHNAARRAGRRCRPEGGGSAVTFWFILGMAYAALLGARLTRAVLFNEFSWSLVWCAAWVLLCSVIVINRLTQKEHYHD